VLNFLIHFFLDFSRDQEWHEPVEITACPAAPLLKDYDSFSIGTGGSFGALPDMSQEAGELFYHPDTLGLAQAADTDESNLSIEQWREEVLHYTLDPSPMTAPAVSRPTDTEMLSTNKSNPLDIFLWAGPDENLSAIDLSMQTTDEEDDDPMDGDYVNDHDSLFSTSSVTGDNSDGEDTPELTPDLPTAVPSVATPSLGVSMKRARSRSPEPSRRIRIRARSLSLSSIHSYGNGSHRRPLPVYEGLAAAQPPWRVVPSSMSSSSGDQFISGPYD
jgi:hypothetical protein